MTRIGRQWRQGRRLPALAGATCWVLAAQLHAATDFRLPPASAAPAVQGPVLEDPAARPAQSRAPLPAATPTPPLPRATLTPFARVSTPAPSLVPRAATPVPAASPAAAIAAPMPSPTTPAPRAATPSPSPAPAPRTPAPPSPSPAASAPPVATGPARADAAEPQRRASAAEAKPPPVSVSARPEAAPALSRTAVPNLPIWAWPVAAAAISLLLALAMLAWHRQRRRRAQAIPVVRQDESPAPPGEPCALPSSPAPPAAPPAPEASSLPPPVPAVLAEQGESPLGLAIEARQLSISLTSATLSWRLTLSNSAPHALRDVVIRGDMISAHSSLPEEDQIARAGSELAECRRIARLPAGQTTQITGEFRLPFTRLRPIRKGDAILFVPLARLRVEAADGGNGPVMQTALIGLRPERGGSALQPFRLDLGPRIYREVSQRIFS